MSKNWQIKDPDEALTEAKRLTKIRAAERGVSIAEALAQLVRDGAKVKDGN